MAGPMDGVKVVEVGMWVAGPAAAEHAQHIKELGALP